MVEEACRSGCVKEGCMKLAAVASALNEAAEGLPELEPYTLKAMINVIAGFLEKMAADARRKGCGRESLLLLEATARLKAFT